MHPKEEEKFGSGLVLIFCLTPKSSVWTYIGPIYHFIWSQKRRKENVFSPPVGKRGVGKSFEKGKSDRKRGEKAKKAAGGDSSRLIPPSGFRPLRQRPAAHFLRPNFPVISLAAIWVKSLTQNWVKLGENLTCSENDLSGHWCLCLPLVLCPILVNCKIESFLVWFQSMLPVTWDTNSSEYIVLFEITNTFPYMNIEFIVFFLLQITNIFFFLF